MAKKAPQKPHTGLRASQHLAVGRVYTRDELTTMFSISDSTIKTGIFKPAAFDSVWLFITEKPTADRTQFDNLLVDDVLHMDGQQKGRTDYLIVEHVERGLELLLFYRTKKYQHPGAGFTFEGRFRYLSHEASAPTKFKLEREISTAPAISEIESELDTQGAFDPTDLIDARRRMLASIVRRQGQRSFRTALLKAYDGRCAVTGCTIEALLEAAHIVPYQGAETNVVSNGLLLRADIHTLFDLGLLWVNPSNLMVELADSLKNSEYGILNKKTLSLPVSLSDRPSVKALQSHLNSLRSLP